MLCSIQHLVKTVQQELTIKRLSGSAIDDSYCNILSFSVKDNWNTLIQQNNVAEGRLHLDLFALVVIAHEFDASRDIFHISISSLWWLLSFPRNQFGMGISIERQRHIQFCRCKVGMIGFCVNSLGGHKHPFCWKLIPYRAEGQLTHVIELAVTRSAVPQRHQALQGLWLRVLPVSELGFEISAVGRLS